MKLMSSTFLSTAALLVALSLSPANADPQQNGMQSGSPPNAGSPSGQGAGAIGHSDGAAHSTGGGSENSGQMTPGEGNAAEGGAAKNPKNAAKEAGESGNVGESPNRNKAKSAETVPTGDTSAKDTKSNADMKSPEMKDSEAGQDPTLNKADKMKTGKSGNDAYEDKSKMGEAGEGKGEHGKVRIDSHEVGKVRTYFTQHRPNVQRIERNRLSISIGIGIPSDIVLYDLPPDVIVVTGACPIKYFLWGEDLVLVDSCSREVVEIIGGVA